MHLLASALNAASFGRPDSPGKCSPHVPHHPVEELYSSKVGVKLAAGVVGATRFRLLAHLGRKWICLYRGPQWRRSWMHADANERCLKLAGWWGS